MSECGSGLGYAVPQTATISGGHDDTTVEFTKIYDSHDEQLDAIEYRGDLDDEGHEISGSWTIERQWSGPFVMTRQRKARVEAEVEVGETV